MERAGAPHTHFSSFRSMKTIFITISRGSLIRNFFHSGVIAHLLDAGMQVVILTPNYRDSSLFSSYVHERLVLEPLRPSFPSRTRRILQELMRAAIYNNTVKARFTYRIASDTDPSPWLYILRDRKSTRLNSSH